MYTEEAQRSIMHVYKAHESLGCIVFFMYHLTAAKTTSKLYSIYTFSMAASMSINEDSKE